MKYLLAVLNYCMAGLQYFNPAGDDIRCTVAYEKIDISPS
jgi:hypothetical protein